jgi:hypothetical protein
MRGTAGLLVGVVLLVVGLGGLGYALHLMMTHADPNTGPLAAAGLATFVIASLASLAVIR